ncbi:hypothetical protein JW707_04930 [Candidatus Woesearchaeota archaeon]|nr:hypothetical protein [Candidatus Woesearchaeota archaeon]
MFNPGKPKYNLTARVTRGAERTMPRDIFELSYKIIHEAGLIGEKHVTEKGVLLDGFADVEEHHIGNFDIFYRHGGAYEKTIPETAQEISTRANIQPGSIPEELEDMAHFAAELLAEADPLSAAMPFGMYMQLPQIESMEISTPAGIQPVHYHFENDWPKPFFRPKQDKYWFDKDQLGLYLFSRYVELENLSLRWVEDNPSKILTLNPLDFVCSILSGNARRKIQAFYARKKSYEMLKADTKLAGNPDSLPSVVALLR